MSIDEIVMDGLEGLVSKADVAMQYGPKLPRPMLAERIVDERGEMKDGLRFPLYASFKLDGYRCLIWQGRAWTRAGKLHACRAVQDFASKIWDKAGVALGPIPDSWALDGELMVPGLDFNKAGGMLRREDYAGPFEYVVYDIAGTGLNFRSRMEPVLWMWQDAFKDSELPIKFLRHYWIENMEELLEMEKGALEAGYEGLCTRAPYGMYKNGRGTWKDQVLCKLKRWHTAEARVLMTGPRMENTEEGTSNVWGLTERGKKLEYLVETDCLGTLEVVGLNGKWKGARFSIGTFLGLQDEDKRELWRKREDLIGQVVTYKYLPIGDEENTRPRHPVFLGFRPDWDMDGGENEKK